MASGSDALRAGVAGRQASAGRLATRGLSDRLLTERLRELESEGLLRRTVRPGPPVRVSYELTESGADLEPVIVDLSRWAERWVKA